MDRAQDIGPPFYYYFTFFFLLLLLLHTTKDILYPYKSSEQFDVENPREMKGEIPRDSVRASAHACVGRQDKSSQYTQHEVDKSFIMITLNIKLKYLFKE